MKHIIQISILSSMILMTGCSNPMAYITPSSSSSPKARTVSETKQETSKHLESKTITRVQYETPTPAKEAKFHQTMIAVAKSTKLDPNYKKLSLNTPEEKAWFQKLMYRLWDRQITRAQFIAEGVAKYPDHKYEFTYIANAFQNY